MCIFNESVEAVQKTKIFATPIAKLDHNQNLVSRHQLTVYSNKVDNVPQYDSKTSWTGANNRNFSVDFDVFQGFKIPKKSTNAMILPFPLPTGAANILDGFENPENCTVNGNADIIKLVNLKNFETKHGKFFKVLENEFPKNLSFSFNGDNREKTNGSRSAPVLEVVEIGGYRCSVARSIHYFPYIDKNVFQINPQLYHNLNECYGNNYGFLICSFDVSKRVDTDAVDAHPIAYIHSFVNNSLFIPCRHEHGGSKKDQEKTENFDHVIYSTNCEIDKKRRLVYSWYAEDVPTTPTKLFGKVGIETLWDALNVNKDSTGAYSLVNFAQLNKIEIKGSFTNDDILLPLTK